MTSHKWQVEQAVLKEILRMRLADKESCQEMLSAYDELMAAVWSFVARLLGDGGARAVLDWSIRLARVDAPLLRGIHVGETQGDFGGCRELIAAGDYDSSELNQAFLRLGETVLQTLSELTGDTVTSPLLKHLEEDSPRQGSITYVPSPD